MIEREQVRHVAHLARLELTPQEEEQFTEQLAGILAYVQQLEELDTTGVDPTFHAIDADQMTRSDQPNPWPDQESLLRNAPERADTFFKVPRILNTEEQG